MADTVKSPVCLIVIDGWGVSDATYGQSPGNNTRNTWHNYCALKSTAFLFLFFSAASILCNLFFISLLYSTR